MKVQSFQPMLKQKIRLWILPSVLSLGIFSANVSQGQTLTDIYWNPFNTNGVGGSGSWSTSPTNWSFNPAGSAQSSNIPMPAVGTNVSQSAYYRYNFGGSNGAVSIGSSQSAIGAVNITSSGYIFSQNGNLSGGGTVGGIAANATTTLGSGVRVDFICPTVVTTVTNSGVVTTNTNNGSGWSISSNSISGNPDGTSVIYLTGTNGFTNSWSFQKTTTVTNVTIYINSPGPSNANTAMVVQNASSSTGGHPSINANIVNNSANGVPLTLGLTSSGNLTNAGAISGANGVIIRVAGSGNMVLAAANSYAGGTVITNVGSGSVDIGNSAAFGGGTVTIASNTTAYIRALAANLDVPNNFQLDGIYRQNVGTSGWKMTSSGVFSGNGSILLTNSGNNLYLTAANSTFGGGVKVANGTLYVTKLGMAGAASSIGTNGTITIGDNAANTGGVRWVGSESEVSDKNFVLNGTTGGLNLTANGSTNLSVGNITSTGAGSKKIALGAYTNSSGSATVLTVNGVINENGGANSVVVGTSQSGTVALANLANTFSGGVAVTNSTTATTTTLRVPTLGVAGQPSPVGTASTITLGAASGATTILEYTGSGETSSKPLTIMGTAGDVGLSQGGTGNFKFTGGFLDGGTSTGGRTIILQNSSTGTGEIGFNLTNLVSQPISLSKATSGTWILSGRNTYSGSTTIKDAGSVLSFTSQDSISQNTTFLGSGSTATIGTFDLAVPGEYVANQYGSSASAGSSMNFTGSSGGLTKLTFTNAANYLTIGNNSARYLTNNSANLSVVFSGSLDIGSSTNNDSGMGGVGSFIFNNSIINSGTGVRGLLKGGSGRVILNAANSYNGPTTVSAGSWVINHSNAIPSNSSGTTVAAAGTLEVNAAITNSISNSGTIQIGSGGSMNASQISGGTVVLAALTGEANLLVNSSKSLAALSMSGNGNISMPLGAAINASGIVGVSGGNNLLTLSGSPAEQTYNLVTGSAISVADGSSICAVVGGVPIALGSSAVVNGLNCAFQKTTTALRLVATSTSAKTLTYDSQTNGAWNLDPDNTTWTSGGSQAAFRDGDKAIFNTANDVTVTGIVQPLTLTFNLESGALNLGGVGSIIAGTLTSSGAGDVTVGTALSVTGALDVSNGSLTLNSNVSAGSVSVSAGTLGGSGTLTAGVGGYTLTGGTVNMPLAGNGPLNLSGNVTLGGDNTAFSGPITITGGSSTSISLTGANGLGTSGLTLSGGTILNLNTDGTTIPNAILLGAGGGEVSVPSSVRASLTGGITNSNGLANLIFSKSGSGKLIQQGVLGASGSTGSIALNITGGDLVLQSGSKYITNSQINTGSKLVLDGVAVNARGAKLGGGGTIEVTNNSAWNNSIGNSSITNGVMIYEGSKLSVNTSTSYYLEFLNGITGAGNFTATSGGTNRITGNSTVAYMTIDSGGKLYLNNGTASNSVITNNGTLDIGISQSITNITGLSSGATTYRGDISGNGNISISGSQNIYLAGNISGINNVSLNSGSSGTQVFLTGSNNFTGGINFAHTNAQAVWFGSSNALGSGKIANMSSTNSKLGYAGSANTADYTFANEISTGDMGSAILTIQPGVSNIVRLDGVVSGFGQFKIGSSTNGAVYLNNGNNTYWGGTEIGVGKIVVGSDGALGTMGAVNFGTSTNSWLVATSNISFNRNFTMSGTSYTANIDTEANDLTITGSLTPQSGSGGNLNKVGSGSLKLLGTASYQGTTTLANGTLDLGGNSITNTALTITTGTLTNGSIKVDASSTGITVNGNSTISANLSGGADFNVGNTNTTIRLSGSNSFAGQITMGKTNNQTLEVTGTYALSSEANLNGSSGSTNTPTLSLLAGGNYQMNKYKDGNFIFTGTNKATTSLTFTNVTNNTISSGSKTLTANGVNVTFSGSIDLAANQPIKKVTFAGNGDFTLNGEVGNTVSANSAGLEQASSGSLTLGAINTYNGPTDIKNGIMIVQANAALPTDNVVTVSQGATLKFLKSSGEINLAQLSVAGTLEQNLVTITSSGAVDLTGSTLKVNGAPTGLSYTLVSAASVTGKPIASDVPSGYELKIDDKSVKLVQSVVVTGSTFDSTYPPGTEEEVGPNGLKNLMSYALGGTSSYSPALPVFTIDANSITLTANIRNDDLNLNVPEKVVGQWALSLEGPWNDVTLTPTGSTSAVPNTTTKRFTQPVDPSQPRKFLRIQVTK